MSEGRRFVPFNDEVPEPGEAVTDHWPEQGEPGMPQRKCRHHDGKSNNGSTAMQQAIAGVTVRPQVEEEKLIVAGELGRTHNNRL